VPILVGIGLIALVSVLSLTPAQRAEARASGRRWNWQWIAIIIAGLAFIFWPRQPN
jgi:hypothetical protein